MQEHAAKEMLATCAIAVMAKASVAGRTKTRLVPPLSADEAAELNTAFLRDVADNLLAASVLASISPWMAYAPAGSEAFFKSNLPAGIGLIETVAPDLGACLLQTADTLLSAGHGTVCLVNSDSPTLPVGYIVAAATVLAAPGDRIVIGPATDGGYYLIGMKRAHRQLFRDVDWSTERVLRQTLARADELHLPVVALPSWYDVDDAASLRQVMGELFEDRPLRPAGGVPTPARWTRAHLSALLEGSDLAARLDRLETASRVA
jgi:rSAM/selenodomain-associated transferase 1